MAHKPLTMDEAENFIGRAAWKSAKSVEDCAPHQYVVRGWHRDDITEEEFDRMVKLINTEGRRELWTPSDCWDGKPQKHRYLYVAEYAYWVTFWGRSMVNPSMSRCRSGTARGRCSARR